jgi:alpha-L-rhamnosidase
MRVVLSFLLFGSLLSAGLKPVRLQCEARTNPLGIDTPRPRLSWILESAENGQRQTAYRILAATKAALLGPGKADLWDSGEVASDESVNLEYAGQALGSGQRCYWLVQVRDRDGQWSTSATAEWTMGLLAPSDWHASWRSRCGARCCTSRDWASTRYR